MKRALIAINFGQSELDMYDDLYAIASARGLPVSTMIKLWCQFLMEKNFTIEGKPVLMEQEAFEKFFGLPHAYKSPTGK